MDGSGFNVPHSDNPVLLGKESQERFAITVPPQQRLGLSPLPVVRLAEPIHDVLNVVQSLLWDVLALLRHHGVGVPCANDIADAVLMPTLRVGMLFPERSANSPNLLQIIRRVER